MQNFYLRLEHEMTQEEEEDNQLNKFDDACV